MDEADEDLFERALVRVEVGEIDAEIAQAGEQRRHAGALGVAIEDVAQLTPVGDQLQLPIGEFGRDGGEGGSKLDGQLLAAELLHQRMLFFDQHQLAAVDHADAIGHFLRLLDVMGGEDDGDAALAQLAHHGPHVAAQLHIDAGGGLVEEQDFGFVRQRFRDHHAALHAARQFLDDRVALVPQRQVAQQLFDQRGVGRAAEQAAAEPHGGADRLERVGVEFLRHEADARAGLAIGANVVVPVHGDGTSGGGDEAADRADQRRLARAIGAEQREDLAAVDVEVHALQRLVTGGIGLFQTPDRNDRLHDSSCAQGRARGGAAMRAPAIIWGR